MLTDDEASRGSHGGVGAQTHAMNQQRLLERAQRCRRLAKGLNDDAAIKALHDLANSYQRQADANYEQLDSGVCGGPVRP